MCNKYQSSEFTLGHYPEKFIFQIVSTGNRIRDGGHIQCRQCKTMSRLRIEPGTSEILTQWKPACKQATRQRTSSNVNIIKHMQLATVYCILAVYCTQLYIEFGTPIYTNINLFLFSILFSSLYFHSHRSDYNLEMHFSWRLRYLCAFSRFRHFKYFLRFICMCFHF